MHITSLDELISRPQKSRHTAGRNLPVRIAMDLDQPYDEQVPADRLVSISKLHVQPCISDEGLFVQIQAVGARLG